MAPPETIENRWDILFREYPAVYDEFSSFPYRPDPIDVLAERFELQGRSVVDVGAGTGRSTLKLAGYAASVVGVEPEVAMIDIAKRRVDEAGVSNVELLRGTREEIPLADASADVVIAVTAGLEVAEAQRVVRRGGLLASIDIPPGGYGGELVDVIGEATPELAMGERYLTKDWRFEFFDFESVQEYGSTDAIVRTFGFIFGRRAIDHLRATGQTAIRWTFRIYHRRRWA